MVSGRGLRLPVVLAVLAVSAVLGYLAQRWWVLRGGGLLAPSPATLVLLMFMGFGVFFAGLPIRRWQRGTAKVALNPLRALRTLVLAQACALTGALVTGWYLAQALVLLPDADAGSVRNRVLLGVIVAIGGLALTAVGLWVQLVCRIRPPDDAEDDDEADGRARHD